MKIIEVTRLPSIRMAIKMYIRNGLLLAWREVGLPAGGEHAVVKMNFGTMD